MLQLKLPATKKSMVALLAAICCTNLVVANQIASAQLTVRHVAQVPSQATSWQERLKASQQQYEAQNFPGQEAAARIALNQAISKGAKGKELADAYEKLADAIFSQYHFPDALVNFQAALDIREKCLPPDSVDVGRSLYGVGYCVKESNPPQALQLLTRCQQIMEKKCGTDSPEVAPALAAMMTIYFAQGQTGLARNIQERLSLLTAKRQGVTIAETYQQKVNTAIFRNLDGDIAGSKQAIDEAKQIRASAPPGYFAPDNLDQHLSWADKRLFKPQNLRSEKIPNAQPGTGTMATPNLATNTTLKNGSEPNQPVNEQPTATIAILPADSRPKPKHPQGRYTYYIEGKKVPYDFYEARVLYNEAGKLIATKQYTLARAKLEESETFDPHFADAECALGTVLAHLGLKEEALTKLQQALDITPQLDSAWIALAGIYEEVGKLGEALDAYRQFLRRFPNDPSHEMILSTTRLAELEFRSRTQASKCPKIDGADGVHDYTVAAARDGLHRWKKSDMPITIYITPLSNRVGNVDGPALVRRSLKEWTDRSGAVVSIKEVKSPAEAKIILGWVTAAGQLNEDAEAGEALVHTSEGVIDSAKVSIDVRKPDADQFEGKLHTTILHEVGHCLGLIGHSPSATDVMYFTELMTGPIPGLSERDVKTVQLIYSYPGGAK